MGLFKEGHYFLGTFAKRQIRVYRDQNIYGIIVPDAKSPSCIELRDGLADKINFGELKQHRSETRNSKRIRVCITIYIPWESNGEIYGESAMLCSKWQVIYVDDLVANIRYISFKEMLTTTPDSIIWGKK